MITKGITVKSTDQKVAKNGTPYLEVLTEDDKKYSIFDQALWNVFAEGAFVQISLEKTGNFWNVKEAVLVPGGEQQDELKPDTGGRKPKYEPQETGMFFKEIGEHIRAKTMPQNPMGKVVESIYWSRMYEVIGVNEAPIPFPPIVTPAKTPAPAQKLTTQSTLPVPKGITDEQLVALTEVVKKGVKLSAYWKKYGWTIAKVKDLTYDQADKLMKDITTDLEKINQP